MNCEPTTTAKPSVANAIHKEGINMKRTNVKRMIDSIITARKIRIDKNTGNDAYRIPITKDSDYWIFLTEDTISIQRDVWYMKEDKLKLRTYTILECPYTLIGKPADLSAFLIEKVF